MGGNGNGENAFGAGREIEIERPGRLNKRCVDGIIIDIYGIAEQEAQCREIPWTESLIPSEKKSNM